MSEPSPPEDAPDPAASPAAADTQNDPSSSKILDQLYGELAGATGAEEDLAAEAKQALDEIESREQDLIEKRAQTEDPIERAHIDEDLDELRRAYQTIRAQLGDDQDSDAPHEHEAQPE